MVHELSSHSWWMVPVFALATVPVLWWRRDIIAVTGIALVVMVVHDLLFGWVTRCGAGLPLAFVLAYLGAVGLQRRRAWIALGLTTALAAAALVVDATTGFEPMVLALPIVLIVFGIGRAVRHRTAMSAELRARTVELRQLRDERVALEVAGDRVRLSQQLDGLLKERLGQLTTAADSGQDLDAAGARTLFESIESDSRATLDGMREIVGLLRGGDVALAPAPSVAHLDALLARHLQADSRLTVTGDPRSLPATVELSAYRIVEHLVNVLADQPESHIEVGVRFDADALEIRVNGPVDRTADVKAAVARARERATFLGGSLDMKVSRGHANAVAQLPWRDSGVTDASAGAGRRLGRGSPPAGGADPPARVADDRAGQPVHGPGRRGRPGADVVAHPSARGVRGGARPLPGRSCGRRGLVSRHGSRGLLGVLRRARAGLVGTSGVAGGAVRPGLPGAVLLPGRDQQLGRHGDVHGAAVRRGHGAAASSGDRRRAGPARRGARGRARAVRRDRSASRAGADRQRAARHRRPRHQRDGDPGSGGAATGRHRPGAGQGGVRRDLGVGPPGQQGPRAAGRASRRP